MLASGPALSGGRHADGSDRWSPVHSTTPRNVALGLALAIGVLGVWLA